MQKEFAVSKINRDFYSEEKEHRDCFAAIENFLTDKTDYSKICAVYGLRRTGKTTLLKQAAESLSLEEQQKALYIECFDGTDFYSLVQYMEDQIKEGYRYFFIDEITYSNGFERIGTILSDKFSGIEKAKIVVTGTDSLGLLLPSKDKMYDRMEFVNTTYMTFPEYARITGIASIDDYIKKGSTLRTDVFDSKKSTDDFIETAVVQNIVHSLKKYEDINRYPSLLTEKYPEEAIRCETQRIINRYSQTRTYKAITSQFKSAPLGDAKDTVLQHEERGLEIISNLKYNEVNKKIAEILGCDKKSGIEDRDIPKIYDYLKEIGVFESIPVYNSYSREDPDEPLEMIVHSGMFHANIRYTLAELQKDRSWIDVSEADKNLLLKKAYESAMGKIMENVIVSDIYHLLCLDNGKKPHAENIKEDLFGDGSRWYVSKLNTEIKGAKHEADVIIFDKKQNECYLFEIKHSSENVKEQSRHLENEAFLDYVEEHFGTIKGRAVLYNGQGDDSPVPRISASLFMKQLYDDFEKADFTIEKTLKAVSPVNTGRRKMVLPKVKVEQMER